MVVFLPQARPMMPGNADLSPNLNALGQSVAGEVGDIRNRNQLTELGAAATGGNINALRDAAFGQGRVGLGLRADQTLQAREEAAASRALRERQMAQSQANADRSFGLRQQRARLQQEAEVADRIGNIALSVQSISDPAERAQLWQTGLQRMANGEIAPELLDPVNGPRLAIAEAGKIKEQLAMNAPQSSAGKLAADLRAGRISEDDYRTAIAGRGGVTVNVGGDSGPDAAMRETLSKKQGEQWSGHLDAAATSAGVAQDLAVLDDLIDVAPQGPLVGALAERFPGFSTSAAAFEAITKRLAPSLRAPGSGSTSDVEYEGFLNSLPRLTNTPEANRIVSSVMKEKSALNIERGDVVSAYQNRQIDADEARRRISDLNRRSILSPEAKALIQRAAPDADASGPVPNGVDPADWQYMTPEERALWN